jgi:hypothetical protein
MRDSDHAIRESNDNSLLLPTNQEAVRITNHNTKL